MEEYQESTKTQQITPTQLSLNLSEKGEIKIQGSITSNQLQSILDASHLRANIYQTHQARLSKEADKTAIAIGVYISLFIGLMVFLGFNLKPQHTVKTSEVTTNERA